jgi:mono/diheme cytochrome c family protein
MNRSVSRILAIVLVAAGVFAVLLFVIEHRGFSTREKPSALEAMIGTSMRDMAIPKRYKTMKNPVTAGQEVIREGMAHWADHCAPCHANNGSGDTMYGKTMYPRPPDMRQNETQAMSDGELYYTIKNGVRLSGMPAFGEPGDDDLDSWKLVAFVRHLTRLSDQEELEMERLNQKSPGEMQEEMEEEQFLKGGKPSGSPSMPDMHH